jgi:hypothetical protein
MVVLVPGYRNIKEIVKTMLYHELVCTAYLLSPSLALANSCRLEDPSLGTTVVVAAIDTSFLQPRGGPAHGEASRLQYSRK